MDIKQDLTDASIAYLKSLSEAILSEYGFLPMRWQQSQWMAREKSGQQIGRIRKRKIIDRFEMDAICGALRKEDFPSQEKLNNLLLAAGIPQEDIWGGFITTLIHHWIKTNEPLDFDRQNVTQIIKEFVDTITTKMTYTIFKGVIDCFQITPHSLKLDDNVRIRPISKEELWEFSDIHSFYHRISFRHLRLPPDENWNVLEIRINHKIGERISPQIESLRQAVLAGVLLLNTGMFALEDVFQEVNYGVRCYDRIQAFTNIKRGSGSFNIDKGIADRFQLLWPDLVDIATSEKHYLRLPLLRLIDGACRDRADDAIIDCSVGLEALLTNGTREELKYRLALRGATILNWNDGNKESDFDLLKEFYDIRSQIVHGVSIENDKLIQISNTGYEQLRRILVWFFDNHFHSINEATVEVDRKILS